MLKKLWKKWFGLYHPADDVDHEIRIYPSQKSCVKHNMSQVRPEHMPPLMVRKPAWRR